MWEFFWNLMIFLGGMTVGQIRATNSDITNQTSYMQDLIDAAYLERDKAIHSQKYAEALAETWERRYWNLLEEEDEEIGS